MPADRKHPCVRVLGIGHCNDLGDLYLRVAQAGHEVRVHIAEEDSSDIFEGMLDRSADWRADLGWIREGRGLLVFETTGFGAEQDALRAEGFRVFGGSAVGDRLELDRSYGQSMLSAVGMRTAPTHRFESFDDAIAFVERVRSRFVLKFNGEGFASTRNYVGVLPEGEDMVAMLRVQRSHWIYEEEPDFVLMQHIRGVEVGVGGFFDGRAFLSPINLDWEHKRFFPGNLGELTGEMGTLVSYRGGDRLFAATLGRLAPLLRESGYAGYINLNMIVNDDGAWPLELTSRFGYPGFAILGALHAEPWDVILSRVVDRSGDSFATHDGFAIGVVLTVPPFPYHDGYDRLSRGAPITFRRDLTDADRHELHYGEVRLDPRDREALVAAGTIGYLMVVTGRGPTVADARSRAYALAEKVVVPNLRYRNDIGEGFEAHDRVELERLGWLG
jgi:phosphoribosylamine--glycine ligase